MGDYFYRVASQKEIKKRIDDIIAITQQSLQEKTRAELEKLAKDYYGFESRALFIIYTAQERDRYREITNRMQIFNHEILRYCPYERRLNPQVTAVILANRFLAECYDLLNEQSTRPVSIKKPAPEQKDRLTSLDDVA